MEEQQLQVGKTSTKIQQPLNRLYNTNTARLFSKSA